jgi:RsiW-degrading membrane proteinase PrsW (M82 family)
MKLKALVILFIIIISMIPVYLFNKYLQKKIRPRESFVRLFGYLLLGFALVFIYTFLVVLIIKEIFPGA